TSRRGPDRQMEPAAGDEDRGLHGPFRTVSVYKLRPQRPGSLRLSEFEAETPPSQRRVELGGACACAYNSHPRRRSPGNPRSPALRVGTAIALARRATARSHEPLRFGTASRP